MFRNREDAGWRLALALKEHPLRAPLVLAIPRGGVVVGAALARELGADLDVVLSRKLRAPDNPELALGAVGEDGHVYLNPQVEKVLPLIADHVAEETRHQLAEIRRRQRLIRGVISAAPVAGRSVILTDDGIATGATMMAALRVLAGQHPHEVIIAVPVAPPDRLAALRHRCDRVVCLLAPDDFQAIGAFYENFRQVEDDDMLAILAEFARQPVAASE
jgi:putative phosphoribosyl transferase